MIRFFKKPIGIFTTHKILSLILLVVIVVAALELTNTTHLFHKGISSSPIIPVHTQSYGVKSSSQKGESSSPSANQSNGSSSSPSSSQANITSPYGSFVSNHSPQISSASLSQENSVCNTSPSTPCYISFSKDGVTKSLPSQTTDSNGTTSWSWDVKSAGLTPGNWTITVFAGSGSDIKTKQDSIFTKG